MRTILIAITAGLALGGCATTTPDADTRTAATTERRAFTCDSMPVSQMSPRMRDRCTRTQTLDKSVLEQQITPCTGFVCGRP